MWTAQASNSFWTFLFQLRLVVALNQLFDCVLPIIQEYDGDVIKFAGDALMIVFNWHNPSSQEQVNKSMAAAKALQMQVQQLFEATERAARCGVAMISAVDALFANSLGGGDKGECLAKKGKAMVVKLPFLSIYSYCPPRLQRLRRGQQVVRHFF